MRKNKKTIKKQIPCRGRRSCLWMQK